MNIEIRNRFTGKIIICGEYESIKDCLEKNKTADLSGADLSRANLSGADLSRANLSGADLSWADLSWANLSWANLSWANLSWANLSWANLSGVYLYEADLSKIPQLNAPTINEWIKQYKVKQNGTKIYLYKGVDGNLQSPTSDVKLEYEIGKVVSVEYADCDVWSECSYGISVSPNKDVVKQYGTKTLLVEVNIGDIVCIPIYGSAEKIRVKKCKVIKEIERD